MNRLLGSFDLRRGLVALLAAILLFAVVRNELNPAEFSNFEVPVDFVDVPPGLLLAAEQSKPTVRVRVSAPRETLIGLHSSSLRAFVDLRRAKSGLEEHSVAAEFPDPRIRLVEIVPRTIPVRLEEITERRVPVQVTRTGNPPFGYEVGSPQVEPLEVVISGPTGLVRRVGSVAAELKLDGITVNVDGSYRLAPLDAQGQPVALEGRNLRIIPETARLRLSVAQQLSYKTVAVRPSLAGGVQTGFLIEGITVDPPVVTVVGTPRSLSTVDFVNTERLDVTDASGPLARQASVLVPDGVSVLPQDVVRVNIRVAPLTLAQLFPTPVLVENLAPDLQVVNSLPTVQVILQGPTLVLRALDPEDVRAKVDLAGREAGSHQLPVQVTAPQDLTVQSFAPEAVPVVVVSLSTPSPPTAPETAPVGVSG